MKTFDSDWCNSRPKMENGNYDKAPTNGRSNTRLRSLLSTFTTAQITGLTAAAGQSNTPRTASRSELYSFIPESWENKPTIAQQTCTNLSHGDGQREQQRQNCSTTTFDSRKIARNSAAQPALRPSAPQPIEESPTTTQSTQIDSNRLSGDLIDRRRSSTTSGDEMDSRTPAKRKRGDNEQENRTDNKGTGFQNGDKTENGTILTLRDDIVREASECEEVTVIWPVTKSPKPLDEVGSALITVTKERDWYRNEASKCKREAAKLLEKNRKFHECYGSKKKEVLELSLKIGQQKKELGDLKTANEGLVEGNETFSDQIAGMMRENAVLKKKEAATGKENAELKKQSAGVTKENKALKTKEAAIVKEITELKTQSTGLVQELEAVKAKEAAVLKENAELKRQSTAHADRVRTVLTEKIRTLEEQSEQLITEVDNFKEELEMEKSKNTIERQDLEKRNSELAMENKRLSVNMEELNRLIDKQELEMETNEQELRGVKENLEGEKNKIATLETQLSEMVSQKKEYESRIVKLNKTLAATQVERKKLMAEKKSVENSLTEGQNMYHSLYSQSNILAVRLDELKGELKVAHGKADDAASMLLQSKCEVKALEAKNWTLSKRLEEVESKATALEERIKKTECSLKESESSCVALRKEREAQEKKIAELSQSVGAKNNELSACADRRNSMQSELKHLKLDKEALEQQLSAQSSSMNARNKSLHKELSDQKKESDFTIAELNQKYSEKQKELELVINKLEKLIVKARLLEETKLDYDRSKANFNRLKTDYDRSEGKCARLMENNKSLEDQLDELNRLVIDKDRSITGLERGITKVQNSLDSLKAEKATLEGDLVAQKEKVSDAEKAREEMRRQLQSSENEIRKITEEKSAEIVLLKNQLGTLGETLSKNEKSKKDLEAQLREAEKSAKLSEEKEKEMDTLRKRCESAEKVVEKQEAEKATLEGDLVAQKEKVSDAEKAREEMRRQLQSSEDEIRKISEEKSAEIVSLKNQLGTLGETLSKNEKSKIDLEAQLREAEKSVKLSEEKEKEMETLRKRCESAEKVVEKQESNISSLSKEIKALTPYKKRCSEYGNINEAMRKVQNENRQYQFQNDKLKGQLLDIEEKNAGLCARNTAETWKLTERLTQLETELKELREKRDQLTRTVEEKSVEIEQWISEMKETEKRVDELNSKIKAQEEELRLKVFTRRDLDEKTNQAVAQITEFKRRELAEKIREHDRDVILVSESRRLIDMEVSRLRIEVAELHDQIDRKLSDRWAKNNQ